MTMITTEDFNPDRVRILLRHNKILNKTFLRQTRGKTGGHVEVLKSIYNALIKPDRNRMDEYTKIKV